MSFGVIPEVIDCPQCRFPAHKDDYHVVGEERVVCNWCGYTHTKSASGTESSRGYGSIHYTPKNESTNGSNQTENIVRLKNPLDLVGRHKTIMEIEKDFDINNSSFYVWNEETQSLECLIGKLPRTIDEEYEERKQEIQYEIEMRYTQGINLSDCKDF